MLATIPPLLAKPTIRLELRGQLGLPIVQLFPHDGNGQGVETPLRRPRHAVNGLEKRVVHLCGHVLHANELHEQRIRGILLVLEQSVAAVFKVSGVPDARGPTQEAGYSPTSQLQYATQSGDSRRGGVKETQDSPPVRVGVRIPALELVSEHARVVNKGPEQQPVGFRTPVQSRVVDQAGGQLQETGVASVDIVPKVVPSLLV